MKRTFIIVIVCVIIIISFVFIKFINYKQKVTEIQEYNAQFEKYLDKEILGTDIASIINKAVDIDENQNIKKGQDGKYIQNGSDSINIEVKINDLKENTIYTMENLYNGGMTEFVQYYNNIKFKSSKVEYNNLGKISYILFEQISS